MNKKEFLKTYGFEQTPAAAITGNYTIYPEEVIANLACHDCGGRFLLRLKGATGDMTETQIVSAIKFRAMERHDCPAVKDFVDNHKKKCFQDILRGVDKLKETEYKIMRGKA